MNKTVKKTLYVLPFMWSLHAPLMANVGATTSVSASLPAYGQGSLSTELSMEELLLKCDELERHDQVAKFTADITCIVDQRVWAAAPVDQFDLNYEPSFAEFDVSIKGKFNSNWTPIGEAQKPYAVSCPSVEKWHIRAIKTTKVNSCDELRAIHSNPQYCESLFAESNCIDQSQVGSKILSAQKNMLTEYDDQECHGHRILDIKTLPGTVTVPTLTVENLPSGDQPEVLYSEVDCNSLGLPTPVNMILKTVDLNKAGQIVQAVQVIDAGEMQDKDLAPETGLMTRLNGHFPAAHDILWRINGSRVEKPEEVCRLMHAIKDSAPSLDKRSYLKMSYYSEMDLKFDNGSFEVGTAQRKALAARY